jgi:antitoxin (DNA-binding transcriptional repressor) of toxin-antitoxin stability system
MSTATIRDLRTHFPRVRRVLEEEGEVVVTDRGRPIAVLRVFDEATTQPDAIDYLGRLRQRMRKPLTKAARRQLDEANRGER